MAFMQPGLGARTVELCRYGTSRTLFRGPERPLDAPYWAVLGGTACHAPMVADPWPDVLEWFVGCPVANLSVVNAGVDLFLRESALARIAAGAERVFVQVLGALNLSNRFYQVHSRRNDRFIGALPPLQALYPEVDFTEFAFTQHMAQTLMRISPDRFDTIAAELRRVWLSRMASVLRPLQGKATLLWLGASRPPRTGWTADLTLMDPWLIDAGMLARLQALAGRTVYLRGKPECADWHRAVAERISTRS